MAGVKQGRQQETEANDAAAAAGVAEPAEDNGGNKKGRVIYGQDQGDQEYIVRVLAGDQRYEEDRDDPRRVIKEIQYAGYFLLPPSFCRGMPALQSGQFSGWKFSTSFL